MMLHVGGMQVDDDLLAKHLVSLCSRVEWSLMTSEAQFPIHLQSTGQSSNSPPKSRIPDRVRAAVSHPHQTRAFIIYYGLYNKEKPEAAALHK
jgi:hypothetical protein